GRPPPLGGEGGPPPAFFSRGGTGEGVSSLRSVSDPRRVSFGYPRSGSQRRGSQYQTVSVLIARASRQLAERSHTEGKGRGCASNRTSKYRRNDHRSNRPVERTGLPVLRARVS